jgi:hypothetical protein
MQADQIYTTNNDGFERHLINRRVFKGCHYPSNRQAPKSRLKGVLSKPSTAETIALTVSLSSSDFRAFVRANNR